MFVPDFFRLNFVLSEEQRLRMNMKNMTLAAVFIAAALSFAGCGGGRSVRGYGDGRRKRAHAARRDGRRRLVLHGAEQHVLAAEPVGRAGTGTRRRRPPGHPPSGRRAHGRPRRTGGGTLCPRLEPLFARNRAELQRVRLSFRADAARTARRRPRSRCRTLFGDEARLGAWAAAGPTGAVERVSLPDKKGLEHTVLKDFSGIALFRRTVEIPDAWAGRNLALHLGSTILPTVAFFNGVCVGRVKTWDAPVPGAAPQAANRFTVRAADVRPGTNTVAVFLGCNDRLSWWSGLYGKLSLSPDGSPEAAIPLAGDAWTCEKLAIPKPGPTQGGSWGARIHPFFKMPVRGVLFYQGEADSRRPVAAYLADHKRFIGLLREGWKRPDLPFYFMQLANHARARNGENGFCEVREAQRLTAEQVPHTGMACSIDIGEDRNIHPQNKREQGRRLALQALRKTYGCRDVVADGPQFRELVRAGRTATVLYKPSSAQLLVKGGVLTGFEARAKGGAWTPVAAEVRDGCVTLTAPFEIEDVRYLWQNYPDPEAVLFDGTGLPAVPFRTCSGDE